MRKDSCTKSYGAAILLLMLSAAIAAYCFRNARKENRELHEELENVMLEEYCRQVEHAEELLNAGNRMAAIDTLEGAVALARRGGVIPCERASGPSRGEILLLDLYRDDTKQGIPHKDTSQFEEYLRSAYPDFPAMHNTAKNAE